MENLDSQSMEFHDHGAACSYSLTPFACAMVLFFFFKPSMPTAREKIFYFQHKKIHMIPPQKGKRERKKAREIKFSKNKVIQSLTSFYILKINIEVWGETGSLFFSTGLKQMFKQFHFKPVAAFLTLLKKKKIHSHFQSKPHSKYSFSSFLDSEFLI